MNIAMHVIRILLITLATTPMAALADAGDWLVRARGIVIAPDDSSGLVGLSSAGVTTPLDGSGVGVDTQVVPEVDITYLVTRNIGIEVIAGMANHEVDLEGPGPVLTSLGFTDNYKIFDTWVLPPTVTVQYHLLPDNNIRPYLGVGVNYTAFLWNDASDNLEAAVGPVDVDMDNGFTWAAQVGVDIDINDRWYFNIDLKYIDIDSTASLLIKNGAFANNSLRVDVDVNPFVFGAGVGMRF